MTREPLDELEGGLRRSEIFLRAVVESIPFDVFAISKAGRYVLQNDTCKEHWGDVVGKTPAEVAPDGETLSVWLANNERAFAVDLPQCERSPSEEAPGEDRAVQGGRETILLVDDDEAVLRFCEATLTRYGYTVLSCRDGRQGLEIFGDRAFLQAVREVLDEA